MKHSRGAEREGDPSLVIAWAGWDHAQQAQALAAYYIDARQNQGWSAEKLRPFLAGLGDYFAGFLGEEARKQGATVETLNEFRLHGAGLPR